MKLKKQMIRMFDIYCTCEKCGKIMKEDPSIMQRGKIVYRCPQCGDLFYSDIKYPQRIYENYGVPTTIENK